MVKSPYTFVQRTYKFFHARFSFHIYLGILKNAYVRYLTFAAWSQRIAVESKKKKKREVNVRRIAL